MNIFGIGGSELVLIILIMLVVAGPKRMIRWAYIMGTYVGKLRKMWEEVVDVMQKEVDAAGLDIEIPKELPTRQNITKTVSKVLKPYTDQVEKELKEAERQLNAAQQPLKETLAETNKALKETHKEASDAIKAKSKSVANGATATSEQKPVKTTESEKSTKAQKSLEDKPAQEDSGFGAWSNPQHPGQQTEQKAK